MASDETITKMRYIVEVWKREGLTHRQRCLMVLGLKGPLQGEADVKKHYFNLVKEIHPDKTHHELSNSAVPIVTSAFKELTKSSSRALTWSRPPAAVDAFCNALRGGDEAKAVDLMGSVKSARGLGFC